MLDMLICPKSQQKLFFGARKSKDKNDLSEMLECREWKYDCE
jgi:uncharacterized protein YbaR (Trm112 family)